MVASKDEGKGCTHTFSWRGGRKVIPFSYMQTEELTMGLTEAAAEKRRLMRLLKAAGVTDEVRKTLIPLSTMWLG